MIALKNTIVYFPLFSVAVLGKHKKMKPKKFVSPTTKGTQCYNCLSLDHRLLGPRPRRLRQHHGECLPPRACRSPLIRPSAQVPNIDCYIPGVAFLCIVITSESAKLVETGQEIGPVRVRTCVPAKGFSKKTVSYSMCSKLSKELSASEMFSRIAVSGPRCTLCKTHQCTAAAHC